MAKRIVLRGKGTEPPRPDKKPRLKPKASMPDDKDRLNLQIDRDLKAWAQDYARRMHTSLTQLITDHFVDLQRGEEGDGVDQIR